MPRALPRATQASNLERGERARGMPSFSARATISGGGVLALTTSTPRAPTTWAVRRDWSETREVTRRGRSSSVMRTSDMRSEATTLVQSAAKASGVDQRVVAEAAARSWSSFMVVWGVGGLWLK